MERIPTYVTPEQLAALQRLEEETGRSRAALIREAIDQMLRDRAVAHGPRRSPGMKKARALRER